ncbi:Re/Si-specific NAD(P)(+) transhydrogenase subunit alpha [Solitalea sp. MAHUQ-68]|uniref:NAD(P) transhydrogenase subunit alpha n=1 Tax=Solitalea agri TaxID=2953739 RepID=A0A9X2F911_9SPHI|nr:Re/Si-specific NAD(P)(+) transhydrogenase subunit alpha [Solitalea agri]MCO4294571.1 Re/Si-specific NAD(P)(+) transhydrogenase subunit alpha [Solitalea agri]
MKVGIPVEVSPTELRVAATPKTVKRLIKQGFQVSIQQNAGVKANFTDKEFEEAGAKIVQTASEVYGQSDIVLKVKEPNLEEVDMMRGGLVLLSYLWPAQHPELLKKLALKKVNAVAMDAIPRISRAQKMDVLSSMANIAGYRAVIEGSYHFGRFLNGQITAAGKVEPAKVLVIGAGVAGLAAIGAANSLGAIVRAFDTRKEVAEQIESMGASFLTVNINEDGATASGYSKEMSKEFMEAEMQLFLEQAKEVDIIITTAQIPGKEAPKLILDYHVAAMKPGSVIVDLAASTGGNCVLTKPGEIYTTANGVTILGKLNQLPNQASQLYGNNLCHLLDDMGKAEHFKIDMEDAVVSRAMVTYNGQINWPPQPLPVSPVKPKTESAAEKAEEKKVNEQQLAKKQATSMIIRLAMIGLFLLLIGRFAPAEFMQHFTVFVLAVFVGWQVIWNVSHSLHTPLMAVTNAISGIIIVGGLLQTTNNLSSPLTILAFVAILVASINIVGGFLVTHRMLKMFKK